MADLLIFVCLNGKKRSHACPAVCQRLHSQSHLAQPSESDWPNIGWKRYSLLIANSRKAFRRLQPEREDQESSWPAMQHCSDLWQKKIQLISASEIPFTKESTRFCVLQKPTAVNNLPFGGLWMKSSVSESICAAKLVKYTRGKFYNSLNKSSREKKNCSTQISLLSVNRAKINQAAEQTNM